MVCTICYFYDNEYVYILNIYIDIAYICDQSKYILQNETLRCLEMTTTHAAQVSAKMSRDATRPHLFIVHIFLVFHLKWGIVFFEHFGCCASGVLHSAACSRQNSLMAAKQK